MFRIEMLPARHGDCLWIEYGNPHAPKRILVDGGPGVTYHNLRARILQLPHSERFFDLVVVTHIDADHIDGIVRLILDDSLGVRYGDIWFNGYLHHQQPDMLGAPEAEILGALLEAKGLPWNRAFGGRSVVVGAEPDPSLVPTGLKVTVVGPTWTELNDLRKDWAAELSKANWIPADPDRALAELEERSRLHAPPPLPDLPDVLGGEDLDTSKANGASICLLVEDDDGKRALLAGDAHGPVLTDQLGKVDGGRRIKVDAFKLPHHGSARNVTPDLLDAVDPNRYLISSSGSYFGHPSPTTIERILERHGGERKKTRLDFNYRSQYNEMWADPDLQKERGYEASYPQGLAVEL